MTACIASFIPNDIVCYYCIFLSTFKFVIILESVRNKRGTWTTPICNDDDDDDDDDDDEEEEDGLKEEKSASEIDPMEFNRILQSLLKSNQPPS